MIDIDKHNVEAHYLDYLEGNLSAEDTARLLSFIDENPDIAELFEDTGDILDLTLEPTDERFGDTDDLKTIPCSEDEICHANIDYWLVAKHENTLSANDVKAVNEFVASNELETTEAYIAAAYLKPNLSETFGDNAVLKRKGGTIIPLLVRFTSIAAVFVFVWLIWGQKETPEQLYTARNFDQSDMTIQNYQSPQLGAESDLLPVVDRLATDFTSITVPAPARTVPNNEAKVKPKLDLFKSEFVSINTSEDIAFNNPPIALNESINLSEMFSDFEQTIAANENSMVAPSNNDLASYQTEKPRYQLKEQYRPVTKALSNFTSLNMSYKKMPEESDVRQTVIQIGKFSFERKKNK